MRWASVAAGLTSGRDLRAGSLRISIQIAKDPPTSPPPPDFKKGAKGQALLLFGFRGECASWRKRNGFN